MDETKRQARNEALHLAVAHKGATETPEQIVKTAQAYYEFLTKE